MKSIKKIFTALSILIIFAAITFSQASEKAAGTSSKDTASEENYISELKSNNETSIVNSAYMLGEIKSKNAVIPLMDIFRKEKDDGTRLVAALSLLKIGDARGVFLVKRSMELEENDGVTIILQHLYNDYITRTKKIKN